MPSKKIVGFAHPVLVLLFIFIVVVNIFVAGYLNSKELDTGVSLAYGTIGGRPGRCAQFFDYCSKSKPCCDSRFVCQAQGEMMSGAKVCSWPLDWCGNVGEPCCFGDPKCYGNLTCADERGGQFCRDFGGTR